MASIKKLTILHSNDLHGDFLAEEVDVQLKKRTPFTVSPVICFVAR